MESGAGGAPAAGGLLHPDAVGQLGRSGQLFLVARTLAEGVYQGRHRTPDRGASTEFYDYRPYVPGDPTGLVDWRLWGRTDRFYIRRFRQDSQLTVMLIVDGSASMRFAGCSTAGGFGARSGVGSGSARTTKLRRGMELAAALAYLAVKQGDRVGLIVTGHEPSERRLVPAGSGWGALHTVVSALESLDDTAVGVAEGGPDGAASSGPPNLAAGLALAAAVQNRRSLAVLVGDALDEPRELVAAAAQLRFRASGSSATGGGGAGAGLALRGTDLALLQVLTDDEIDLGGAAPTLGGARFHDPETGRRWRAEARAVAASYTELVRGHIDSVRAGIVGLGGRYALCRTSADPIDNLRALLTQR